MNEWINESIINPYSLLSYSHLSIPYSYWFNQRLDSQLFLFLFWKRKTHVTQVIWNFSFQNEHFERDYFNTIQFNSISLKVLDSKVTLLFILIVIMIVVVVEDSQSFVVQRNRGWYRQQPLWNKWFQKQSQGFHSFQAQVFQDYYVLIYFLFLFCQKKKIKKKKQKLTKKIK